MKNKKKIGSLICAICWGICAVYMGFSAGLGWGSDQLFFSILKIITAVLNIGCCITWSIDYIR